MLPDVMKVGFMQETRLDNIIDSICNRGCQYVNMILSDSQARSQCEELEALDREQQIKVMHELKSVMSVYQQTGGCEL